MLRRIFTIVRKELLQLRRDSFVMSLAMGIPILQLVLFGYVVTFDVKNIPTIVYDLDKSAESREFVKNFTVSKHFLVEGYVENGRAMEEAMNDGRGRMAIYIPHGFSRHLSEQRPAPVQIIVDGSDANTATIVMNYASSVMRRNSIGIITERIGRSPMLLKMIGRVGGIEGRSRIWYNPDLKSSNYMVPGVICLVLLLNCVILMAVAFVRERESKTLEQLLATPVKPVELILGKVIPYILISFVNVVSVALIAVFWFRIDIKGSLILLFLLSLLFLISALGIGLLISVISKTQYQALMTAIFILLPSVLLSGFIFPIANMPKVIQYLTLLIPMRYYLIIVRGIFLKGVGIGYLWGEVWPLIVFGVATLYLSTLWFRKRMD